MIKPQTKQEKNSWETPQLLFDSLNQEFNFNLDVCATKENAKCEFFFTKEDNALIQSWNGNCFMNPPYSKTNIKLFCEKALIEITTNELCRLIVGILPVRTYTQWFHKFVYRKSELRFLEGRVKFCFNGIPSKTSDFYATMIVIWRK